MINTLGQLADYIKDLERFPTKAELKIKNHKDKSFPTLTTLKNRLGDKLQIAKQVADFSKDKKQFTSVLQICEQIIKDIPSAEKLKTDKDEKDLEAVYLMKSGKHYKIGRSKHTGGRNYQLGIQLPEKVRIIHEIQTDDSIGIEKYWHERFKEKRKNGEWFSLDSDDIKAFKRRKFM